METEAKAGATPKLNAALAKAQAVIKGAIKDKTNPAFKSKYADMEATIDAVREAFAANGLGFFHEVGSSATDITVRCRLVHESVEERDSGALVLPLVQRTPQAVGSALTYGRRYTLQAMAGVAAEDDDGNAASKAPVAGPAGVEKLRQMATAPASAPRPPAFMSEEPPPISDDPRYAGAPETDAPVATHDRTLSFAFGKAKGVPLANLTDDDISFYRGACRKTLSDASKHNFHAKETLKLAALESELRFRGLPV